MCWRGQLTSLVIHHLKYYILKSIMYYFLMIFSTKRHSHTDLTLLTILYPKGLKPEFERELRLVNKRSNTCMVNTAHYAEWIVVCIKTGLEQDVFRFPSGPRYGRLKKYKHKFMRFTNCSSNSKIPPLCGPCWVVDVEIS